MGLNAEPSAVVVGDTVRWRKTIDSFAIDDETDIEPIEDSYTLKYTLQGPSKISITATVDGDDYLVNEAASTTASWTPGSYLWTAFLSKGSDRYRIDSGRIEIKKDFEVVSAHDTRTHAQKALEAIEAVLENRAGSEVLNYTIAGRTVSKIPHTELMTLRDRYRQERQREVDAEKLANGIGGGNNIFVRFG